MTALIQPETDPDDALAVARRIAAASDARRRAVERSMHDGVQQHMALLGLKLSMLQRQISQDPQAAVAQCEELREEIQGALAELRAVAHQIYPAILANEGLASALERAARRLEVRTEVSVVGPGDQPVDLPAELSDTLYFCCLEALQNAAQHAGAGVTVTIRVLVTDTEVRAQVSDDGAGFDPRPDVLGAGLQHLADRVHALHGRLEIHSSGRGTRVDALLPR